MTGLLELSFPGSFRTQWFLLFQLALNLDELQRAGLLMNNLLPLQSPATSRLDMDQILIQLFLPLSLPAAAPGDCLHPHSQSCTLITALVRSEDPSAAVTVIETEEKQKWCEH